MRSLAVAFCLTSVAAFAHGAYPLAYSMTERPGLPSELVVGTTFGMLISTNGGSSWSWVCEEAVGYGSMATPKWSIASSGALFAAGFRGLHVSHDDGCSWAPIADFDATGAADLVIDGTTLIACSGKYDADNRIMKSTDEGLTWKQVGPSNKTAFFSAVKLAPSRKQRVYISEWWFQPVLAAIHVSDDFGESFTRIDLTAVLPTASAFTVLAVDPTNPDVFYASVTEAQARPDGGPPASLLVKSADAGQSFTTLFTAVSQITSATVSADGATIFAATGDGLFKSSDRGATFAQVKPPTRSACADDGPGALYACGWPEVDGFALAKSDDTGTAPFTPVLKWSQVCGVSKCPAESKVTTICDAFFPALQVTFPPDLGEPSTVCGNTPMPPKDAGPVDPDPKPEPPKGCGCEGAVGLDGISLLVLLGIRRRLSTLRCLSSPTNSQAASSARMR